MHQYMPLSVLAATVGMCATARPVERVVLTSEPSSTVAARSELRLPLESCEPEETARALEDLLTRWHLPVAVVTDVEARDERFHELVDREFLEILTPEEAHELEALTQ